MGLDERVREIKRPKRTIRLNNMDFFPYREEEIFEVLLAKILTVKTVT